MIARLPAAALCGSLSRGGGIGRRAGFRCQFSNESAGSTPVLGTTKASNDAQYEPVIVAITGFFIASLSIPSYTVRENTDNLTVLLTVLFLA